MYGINRLSVVGWSLVLVGILMLLANMRNGGRPEWLFDAGLTSMVAGSVLRVYGKYGPSRK